jgi:hypothetical protein
MMTKGELIAGAYTFLKVSGITTQPTGDELALAVQVADDYFAQLSISMDTGYYHPSVYGESTGADDSGLRSEYAGAAKKLLAVELYTTFYDADIPIALQRIASQGMNALQHAIVSMPPTQLPSTLPQGSGNDYLEYDNIFFSGATPSDTIVYNKGDVINKTYDWNYWLNGANLFSVTYGRDGLSLSNEAFDDGVSSVDISFISTGLHTLCMKATSDNGMVKTVRFNFFVNECEV